MWLTKHSTRDLEEAADSLGMEFSTEVYTVWESPHRSGEGMVGIDEIRKHCVNDGRKKRAEEHFKEKRGPLDVGGR